MQQHGDGRWLRVSRVWVCRLLDDVGNNLVPEALRPLRESLEGLGDGV